MSLTLTRDEVVTRALLTLGVLDPSEGLDATMASLGAQLIEEMIDNWNTQALTVLVQDRLVLNLTPGRGGPDDPYTIGPGGDFDTGTAARPVAIRNATLKLNTASNYPTEIPLAILTDDMYAANAIKSIQNAQPQSLYYQASVPLGRIQLWNIPNTSANQLVLYVDHLTEQFANGVTVYVCPPGYAKAFRIGAAYALSGYYKVPMEVRMTVKADAEDALRDLKLQNVPMADLSPDPAFISDTHGTYVIQTDQGA